MSLMSAIKTSLRLAVIVVGLIALNFELTPILEPVRLDLTDQQLYTLSPGSQQILKELNKPVDLYFYFSSQAAQDLMVMRSYSTRIESLLREYVRASDGRLRLHVIDPAPFSADETRALKFGLQAAPIGKGGMPVYFGLAIADSPDHHASIGFFALEQQAFLEYEISRLLQGLSRTERPMIGLLSSLPLAGGFDVESRKTRPPWQVYLEISKVFDVHQLAQDVEHIPSDLKVLMLVHPRRLSNATLRGIDQFVLRGGRMLVFVDPYSEQDRGDNYFGIPSKDKSSDLAPLFKAWGIKLSAGDVLGDGAYGQFVTLAQSAGPIWQPTALGLPAAAMNPKDVITTGLHSLNLTTVGVLSALPDATTRLTPLLYSSDQAMLLRTAHLDHLQNPQELAKDFKATGERYLIAVRLEGAARSAFDEPKEAIVESAHINVVIVADTDVLSDNLWVDVQGRGVHEQSAPWADNSALVLNALDSLSGSDALISLRSRGHYTRTFTVVERLQQQARERFLAISQDLQGKLSVTEGRLAALNAGLQSDTPLTAEEQSTLEQFTAEKMALQTEMRRVARQLNVQVELLGLQVRLLNIVAVPALLTLAFLLAGLWRRRRQVRSR